MKTVTVTGIILQFDTNCTNLHVASAIIVRKQVDAINKILEANLFIGGAQLIAQRENIHIEISE